MIEVTKNILKTIYKERSQNARKYDFGLLMVIGGSDFYSGSPALSALAAFKAGVDMIRIVAPKRAADIIASFSPDMAAYPLDGHLITKKHVPTLLSLTESAKAVSRGNFAVLIGGGMGRSPEIQEAILDYFSQVDCRAVIDADAIYAVSKSPEIFRNRPFLFTPHKFEFFILTGKEVLGKPLEEQIKIVHAEAQRLGTTILLKGREDIISDGKEIAVNRFGSPYLTVGGTGDTLAGIAGALMARGINAFEAGQAAALINSLAGESVAKKIGESLMATDVIAEIPSVLKSILS